MGKVVSEMPPAYYNSAVVTVKVIETYFTQKGLVLQYQLHNRVESLADVSTRCSGLLQGEDVKLVLENQPFLMPEPAEKPSLHLFY